MSGGSYEERDKFPFTTMFFGDVTANPKRAANELLKEEDVMFLCRMGYENMSAADILEYPSIMSMYWLDPSFGRAAPEHESRLEGGDAILVAEEEQGEVEEGEDESSSAADDDESHDGDSGADDNDDEDEESVNEGAAGDDLNGFIVNDNVND